MRFNFEFQNPIKNAVTGRKASGCLVILKVRKGADRLQSDSYYLQHDKSRRAFLEVDAFFYSDL